MNASLVAIRAVVADCAPPRQQVPWGTAWDMVDVVWSSFSFFVVFFFCFIFFCFLFFRFWMLFFWIKDSGFFIFGSIGLLQVRQL